MLKKLFGIIKWVILIIALFALIKFCNYIPIAAFDEWSKNPDEINEPYTDPYDKMYGPEQIDDGKTLHQHIVEGKQRIKETWDSSFITRKEAKQMK